MQSTTLQYKLLKKVKDERFDEEKIHQYNLFLQIGVRDFQLAIIQSTDNRVLFLEDYVLPNTQTDEGLLEVLESIFDGHEILKAGFWNQIKVSVKNNKFAQVPDPLFVESAAGNYLQFNADVDPEMDEISSIQNNRANAHTIFALRRDLKQWLHHIYPSRQIIFMHQSAALIEEVMENAKDAKDNPLYTFIDRFKLHILSCKQNQLTYYNQFTIKQFSDYVKYIMMVMKSLGMNQQTSEVVLWGYIGKNSPHYQEFYKYISNVKFGDRPRHLHFGYMFDEIQDHHFFDLYGMHLIG
ncbi:MAG TPA: DUF3822 family protein [Cyclobacteriaceae bacterium]|nr:DUF3822 family protein [Cyclobacteriaceae bacterium]